MNRIILLTLRFSFLSNLEKLNTITKIPNPMKASHIARPIGNLSLKISILKNVIRVPTTSQTAARPIILGFVKYFTNFSLSSKKTFAAAIPKENSKTLEIPPNKPGSKGKLIQLTGYQWVTTHNDPTNFTKNMVIKNRKTE